MIVCNEKCSECSQCSPADFCVHCAVCKHILIKVEILLNLARLKLLQRGKAKELKSNIVGTLFCITDKMRSINGLSDFLKYESISTFLELEYFRRLKKSGISNNG